MSGSSGPSSLPLRAALGLAALALVAAACGDGKAIVEQPTSTSTPSATSTPAPTLTPVATPTPERIYIPPSIEIPEENRHYLGSVVDIEDVLTMCSCLDNEEGATVARFLMEKGAEVKAPVSGVIVGVFGGPTTIYKGVEIEYSPQGNLQVSWVGASNELVAGNEISEGTILGTIGEGLFKTIPDTNVIVKHRRDRYAGTQKDNTYVDESGRLYTQ